MLTARVIPCLDVKDGRIVKGVRFANLRDAGDPAERAAIYEQTGADGIVVLDVSATLEARKTRVATGRAVRARLSIPLTVGGGVRTIDDAGDLLDAGADKVATACSFCTLMLTASAGKPSETRKVFDVAQLVAERIRIVEG